MKSIIVALGRVSWEAEFVSAISHPMTGVRVHRRCVDAVDVRAAIQISDVDVVVISDSTLRVDDDFVAELEIAGLHLVVITEHPTSWSHKGASHIIDFSHHNPIEAVSQFASWLNNIDTNLISKEADRDDVLNVDLIPRNSKYSTSQSQATISHEVGLSNQFVAVLGFGGGAGRTTCMRELSWHTAQRDLPTLMVEADTFTPAIAIELGLNPHAPTLVDIVKTSESYKLGREALSQMVTSWRPNIDVIPGLHRASQWQDLRAIHLRKLWNVLASNFSRVFLDLGPILENEQLDSSGLAFAQRHAVSLTVLERANKIVICINNSDVAISRFIRQYLEIQELLDGKDCRVVLWGNRTSKSDGLKTLNHFCSLTDITYVATDNKLALRATQEQRAMSEIARKSSIAMTYRDLALALESDARDNRIHTRLSRLFNRSLQNEAA